MSSPHAPSSGQAIVLGDDAPEDTPLHEVESVDSSILSWATTDFAYSHSTRTATRSDRASIMTCSDAAGVWCVED
jgi:hypothetical protein